ncbi:MAG TPA: DUF5715 family protein [Rhodothermales bacterium]|nr:DUF5715 family protein [Rhodothermales bacterium]
MVLTLIVSLRLVARQVEAWRAVLKADLEALEQRLAGQEAALAAVPLLTASERAALRRPAYADHVRLGERLGVPPEATREARARDTALVRLSEDRGYALASARYSVPFATPDAAAVLDSIAARFRAGLARRGLPPVQVIVTSVLRSGEDQEELRRVNSNAAAGRSSHEFGVSFDLTYRRFQAMPDTALARPEATVPPFLQPLARARRLTRLEAHSHALVADYPSRLDALLGRTLLALKARGVLVVLRERRQPVYHVTVARTLTPARRDSTG